LSPTAGTNGGGSGGDFPPVTGSPKGSILSFENGLYYINGGTGGAGGVTGVANSGGQGGAGVYFSIFATAAYGDGLVVFTYVPTVPVASNSNFFMFF
jgi:hypothetical protein